MYMCLSEKEEIFDLPSNIDTSATYRIVRTLDKTKVVIERTDGEVYQNENRWVVRKDSLIY